MSHRSKARCQAAEFGFSGLNQEGKRGQKKFGDALLHPRWFHSNLRVTSSFLLSSSLPFYSPPSFLNFPPALLAERVFNHHV